MGNASGWLIGVVGFLGLASVVQGCRDFSSGHSTQSGEQGGDPSAPGDMAGGLGEASPGGGAPEASGGQDASPSLGRGGAGGADVAAIVVAGSWSSLSGGDSSSGGDDQTRASAGMQGAAGAQDGGASEGGAPLGPGEPGFQNTCLPSTFFAPQRVRALGSSATYSGSGPALYAVDAVSQTVVINWPDPGGAWVGWVCFDLLPYVARVAGTNGGDGMPEIFGSTDEGFLFVRRQTGVYGGWTPWLLFSGPAHNAPISDVATATSPMPSVYVVANGQVYQRRMLSPQPVMGYGPWRALPAIDAQWVSASVSEGQPERVLASTLDGQLFETHQSVVGDDGSFLPWQGVYDFAEEVADIDAINLSAGPTVFVLLQSGNVWKGTLAGSSATWELVAAAKGAGLVSLTAETLPDREAFVVGLTQAAEIVPLVHESP